MTDKVGPQSSESEYSLSEKKWNYLGHLGTPGDVHHVYVRSARIIGIQSA
jgi:hypothetical protein